jgi:hypothetical protein
VTVQRRIWLLQAAFWPVAALCFIVAAVAVARLIWRRRQAAAALDDVKVAPPDRATRGVVGSPD